MSEKIKKLTYKVEGLVKFFGSPQQTYDNLIEVAKRQKEYFEYLGPTNFIKLSLYIYSIKDTGSLYWAEKVINNLSFIQLLETDNTHTMNACDYCGGDGYINCDTCFGTGKVECDDCRGEGEEECGYCGGDGKMEGDEGLEECDYCDGSGNESCNSCGGDGDFKCSECNGNGDLVCQECDGNGEIESEEYYIYTIRSILTWSKEIQDVCEIRVGQPEPALSEDDFDELHNEYIVLNLFEDNGPINLIEDEMYCINNSDEPKLSFSNDMKIQIITKNQNLNYLYK